MSNEITKLFEMDFSDSTKLWASEQNGKLVFGSLGNGINRVLIELMNKMPYSKVCFFAYQYSKNSKYVVRFFDNVEHESNELQKALIKAC